MTKRWAAVAGDPVEHSLSPLIHQAWLEEAGVPARYDRLAAPSARAEAILRRALEDDDCAGLNITLPHKALALSMADRASQAAQSIGAANLLVRRKNCVYADNTDGEGFLYGLRRQAPNMNLSGANVLVLGAGGAARAVVHALTRARARIRIANRTLNRATALADAFSAEMAPWPAHCAGAELVVNTTSLGLDGDSSPLTDFSNAAPGAAAYDLVYRPLETPFLRAARAQGLATIDGLDMLIGQARPAFKAFFGVAAPQTNMRERLIKAMDGS